MGICLLSISLRAAHGGFYLSGGYWLDDNGFDYENERFIGTREDFNTIVFALSKSLLDTRSSNLDFATSEIAEFLVGLKPSNQPNVGQPKGYKSLKKQQKNKRHCQKDQTFNVPALRKQKVGSGVLAKGKSSQEVSKKIIAIPPEIISVFNRYNH